MKISRIGQSGFLLIEALIGLALLAVIASALAGVSFFVHKQNQYTGVDECKIVAKASLENIKSLGLANYSAKYTTDANLNYILDPSTVKLPRVADSDLADLNSVTVLRTNAGKVEVSNYKGMLGSVAFLNALYNKKLDSAGRSYCGSAPTDFGGIPSAPATGEPILKADAEQSGIMTEVKSYLKIQLFDPVSGAAACAPHPIYLKPMGITIPSSVNSLSGVTFETIGNLNSFLATVTTEYKDKNGNVANCQASEVFSYPRIKKEPDAAAISIYSDVIKGKKYLFEVNPPVCRTQEQEIGFKIDFPDNAKEKGLVILCQDGSTSGSNGATNCPGGAKERSVSINSNWVSCSKVPVCGTLPEAVEYKTAVNGAITKDTVLLGYSNLPWGCTARLNVQVVDPAGNIVTTGAQQYLQKIALPQCASCDTNVYAKGSFCPASAQSSMCTRLPPPVMAGGGGRGGGGSNGGTWGKDYSGDGRPDTTVDSSVRGAVRVDQLTPRGGSLFGGGTGGGGGSGGSSSGSSGGGHGS